MYRHSWLAIPLLFAMPTWAAGALTPLESHWLDAASPVLQYAADHNLPIDVIVHPDDRPGDAPVAMGVEAGRCKLVMSMRGNPLADRMLDGVPAALTDDMIQAMAAHELAHCWRYQQGVWHALPAGFSDVEPTAIAGDTPASAELRRQMALTRREEAFADLAGLAWIAREHPADYAQVYRWFEHVRADQPASGSYHDTHAWLQLAPAAAAFEPRANIFEAVQPLWKTGLAVTGEAAR